MCTSTSPFNIASQVHRTSVSLCHECVKGSPKPIKLGASAMVGSEHLPVLCLAQRSQLFFASSVDEMQEQNDCAVASGCELTLQIS